MRSFRSDNNAGLCEEAIQAIIEANDGSHVTGYGDDHYTQIATDAFQKIFGKEVGVWFVATGTAANTLAIASLTDPWQRVLCHEHSHLNDDESTALERVTQCRMATIRGAASKIDPAELRESIANTRGDVHQPQPGVVSISNSTEFGEVYAPEEVRALAEIAHDAGYRLHVDGARFANAVASVGCHPRELCGEAGVDAMSFGGTKNGLAMGEVIILFRQGDGRAFERANHALPYLRKAGGHLLSKHRFVTAPFAATLKHDAWLKHARHANKMAALLGDGLTKLGLAPVYPVSANGVFVRLEPAMDAALRQAGYGFYPFGHPADRLFRFMCSFDTTPSDVEGLLMTLASHIAP